MYLHFRFLFCLVLILGFIATTCYRCGSGGCGSTKFQSKFKVRWRYSVACETTDLFARAGLANHLRNMQHPDFLVLMQELYVSFLNAVQGLQEQGRVVIEILDSVTP
jgi:hypothetical protein